MSTSTDAVAREFVSAEVFGAYVNSVNSRLDAEEKLNDLRMDRIEALIGESNATISGAINLLNERLNRTNDRIDNLDVRLNERIDNLEKQTEIRFEGVETRLSNIESRLSRLEEDMTTVKHTVVVTQGKVGVLSEKLEHVVDTLNVAINGTDQRITDMKEDLKVEQNKSLAKWGIGVALFVGAVQVAVSVVLHFWH